MTATSPGFLALLSLSPDLAAGLGVALGLLVGAAAAGWVVRTRERRARAAVEASDALHRRLFDEAADVMLLHDTDGGALRVNAAGRAVLCVATDTPSLSLLDAVAVADRAMLRRHLAALEADEKHAEEVEAAKTLAGIVDAFFRRGWEKNEDRWERLRHCSIAHM